MTGRVADFHSLRHSFISNLARGGVHPKVAQALARHSTIVLAMDRYSHTLVGEQADALNVLPDLSAATRQVVRATGTDQAKPERKNLASYLALSGGFSGTPIGAGGRKGRNADDKGNPSRQGKNVEKDQAEGEGFEPSNACALPVFKTGAIGRSATPPVRSS